MPGGSQSHRVDVDEPSEQSLPDVAACRSCPGRLVFIESGNTDGWIATDSPVAPSP